MQYYFVVFSAKFVSCKKNKTIQVNFNTPILKLFLLLFGLLFSQITAQELPPILNYSPEHYGGENQNWAISQSSDKFIYIANDLGLLEFNGANWQLYPSPNNSIMRSVYVQGKRIYTGCYMEFGFWEKNDYGQLIYTSLSNNVSIPLIEDEQFWSILTLDNWVLFQSLNRIYIYNTIDSSFKTIDSTTRLTDVFKVNETIYFQKLKDGLYKIENGSEVKISNDILFQDQIIVNIFDFDHMLLIQTQEKGFHIFDDGTLKKWDIPANEVLSTASVYSSIRLEDQSFVLGTISHGIFHLTPDGKINYEINQSKGLSNNTILSLFEDIDNNIWLGLDNGIDCVNIKSPFRIFNDDNGFIGTVYASTVYKENLYIGTNQGLFYKRLNSEDDFKFITGTKGQVWSLTILDDVLFCGHNIGTLIVNSNQVSVIDDSEGTWNIKRIDTQNNLLLQGKYNGFNILEKSNGNWKFRNKIEGFNNASRFIEWYKDTDIFVSHEYKGVFKITVNNDFTKASNVVKDSTVTKGLHSSILKYDGDILYSYKAGIFKYNESINAFERDSIYSRLIDNKGFISGKLIRDETSNKLWYFTDRNINYLSPGTLSSIPNLESIALPNSLRNGKIGYENITHIGDQSYLLGASEGYIIIDLSKIKSEVHEIEIKNISIHAVDESETPVNLNLEGDFKNKDNNISFSYSIPEFDQFSEVEYQYQLEGIYNQWSNWTTRSNETFNNLPHGDYTFNVKARIGNNETRNIATYHFKINRPWYLSNTLWVIYILSFIMITLITHNLYKRYYKKQREKLLEKTERELELKKLENEQQLMSFENEKLQNDIESKNRELAISTMSLIKKNEFLNTIKLELNDISDQQNLKTVIGIIDKNLNNTDDWKLFQEAFNNADKDFLKKIKSIHASLTPNDLRLCAYLRLNLSSKEIAPLLNISPRSVEVKRYRLRKKMNLSHEASLTNYILDI